MWNPSKFFKQIVKKKHVKSSQNFVMSNGDDLHCDISDGHQIVGKPKLPAKKIK